jgi:hypothetical protein
LYFPRLEKLPCSKKELSLLVERGRKISRGWWRWSKA